MPHLILEHSNNINDHDDFLALFHELHQLLKDTLPTTLESCKSRVIKHETFLIGDKPPSDSAFVCLTIKVLKGRTAEILDNVKIQVLEVLKSYFYRASKQLDLSLSVEIKELSAYYITP